MFVLICVAFDKFPLVHIQSKLFLVFCAKCTGHKFCSTLLKMENINLYYYCHSTDSDGHTMVMAENYTFPTESRFFVCNLPTNFVSNTHRNIYIQQWGERIDISSFIWFHRELDSFLDDFQLHTKYCLITCEGNRNNRLKHCHQKMLTVTVKDVISICIMESSYCNKKLMQK